MNQPRFQIAKHALVAVGSIAVAVALRAGIDSYYQEPIQYTTFYIAVMVTALYGGRAWGFTTALLAAYVANFWQPSLGPATPEPTDFYEASIFLVTSFLIVWMSHRMLELRLQAEAAAEERHRLLVAEQAARHEAERLNHVKDDFLAAISHELRTPLQSILGWTQMLREYEMDPEETELATASIERSAKIQTQLINDLLDLSRIVMGKLRLEVRPVALADVVQAAVQTVYPAAQAKRVRVEVSAETLTTVLGDNDRLQQVVWNLLSNAIKFTPAGGTICATVKQQGDDVELIVSDTGEGIEPAFLQHAFERFHQAENGRRRDGLGLGLAIVKELVELHGGTISVRSAGKGQGSVFRILLPARMMLASVSEEKTQSEALQTPVSESGSRTVLRRAVCSPFNHVSSAS